MKGLQNLPTLTESSGFAKYIQEVNKIPSLTPEEELLLAKNYVEHQDLEAAHRLVTSHLKLVVKIAISYRGYGLPMVEMVSEGNLGLMHAVKKFDPNLGNRLSTYAMWWIKASIQEYILRSWSMVKIGTTNAQKKLFFSLGKIKTKIRQNQEREINHADYLTIADDLGVAPRDVRDMDIRLSKMDASLNEKRYGDEEGEMMELIPEKGPNQEILLLARQDAAWKNRILTQALQQLNSRELDIFSKRKLHDPALTLDELSKQYNISKERVRQIENAAFVKVQNAVLSYAKS